MTYEESCVVIWPFGKSDASAIETCSLTDEVLRTALYVGACLAGLVTGVENTVCIES